MDRRRVVRIIAYQQGGLNGNPEGKCKETNLYTGLTGFSADDLTLTDQEGVELVFDSLVVDNDIDNIILRREGPKVRRPRSQPELQVKAAPVPNDSPPAPEAVTSPKDEPYDVTISVSGGFTIKNVDGSWTPEKLKNAISEQIGILYSPGRQCLEARGLPGVRGYSELKGTTLQECGISGAEDKTHNVTRKIRVKPDSTRRRRLKDRLMGPQV